VIEGDRVGPVQLVDSTIKDCKVGAV